MNRSTTSAARKAQLGMTAALAAAVIAGGALALFNSHSARATTVRAEAAQPAPEPASQTQAPAGDNGPGLSGAVLETLPVSNYTYLRLSTSAGEVWAAVPSANVAVGSQVAIANATRMDDFKSSTLKRTFKEIYFGTLAPSGAGSAERPFSPADILDEDEQALPAGHPDVANGSAPGPVNDSDPLPAGHPALNGAAPHGGATPAASGFPDLPAEPIAAARGRNAHVIVELGAQRHELAGQRVRVRGQVTKVTPNVQGHTFFHLRDRNPKAAAQPTDLVVTSTFEPSRGQVATFEGILRADVDIGIGYSFPVLLENATVVPE